MFEMKRVDIPEESSQDKPWLSDYLKQSYNVGVASPITRIKPSRKGFFIETENFKYFAFTGTKLYDYLLEAIPYFKLDMKLPFRMYAEGNPQGKLVLCLEENEESFVVAAQGGGVDFSWEKEVDSSPVEGSSNPFLTGLTSPTTESARAKKTHKAPMSSPTPPF